MTNNLLLQSLGRALPAAFVQSLARDVEWAYKEAYAASYNNPLLDPSEADYHYPHYRRSIMEKRVRDSARKAGLDVVVSPNAANNYQYTELSAGDWNFTLKHTSDERYMLKSSIFRRQSAALNELIPQLTMPSILGSNPDESRPQFSAIIYHATDRGDCSTPGFIKVGVPKEDFSWWEARFDIHELLAESVETPNEEEIKTVVTWKNRAVRNTNQR